jgi:hypothetical protein
MLYWPEEILCQNKVGRHFWSSVARMNVTSREPWPILDSVQEENGFKKIHFLVLAVVTFLQTSNFKRSARSKLADSHTVWMKKKLWIVMYMYETVTYVHMHVRDCHICTYACTRLSHMYICTYETVTYVHMHVLDCHICTYACTRLSHMYICMYETVTYVHMHVRRNEAPKVRN